MECVASVEHAAEARRSAGRWKENAPAAGGAAGAMTGAGRSRRHAATLERYGAAAWQPPQAFVYGTGMSTPGAVFWAYERSGTTNRCDVTSFIQ